MRLARKYELQGLAGTGGMAEVFRGATHGAQGFQRPVAVKRILADLSENPEFVEMFVEEARVCAALQHPNIVQIHDFDQTEDGTYFLVMEWVEGINHLQWRRSYHRIGEPTPWPLVAAIGIETLKGLGAAHENRDANGRRVPVFHRDVTPQNILMGVNGIVKLTDFGLARAMDRARMTRPEMVKGKLAYLAPEMAAGAEASPQSDIFSLGVVLWEALTCEPLFYGDNPLEVLSRVKEAEVPAIREIREDIPRALHDAVHRALHSDPTKRFKSARSMVRALANILRMTPESTSAEVLGRSVLVARQRLLEGDFEVLDSGEFQELPPSDPHIPLTRKK